MEREKFKTYLTIILIIILIGLGFVYFLFLKKSGKPILFNKKTSEDIETAAIKAGKTKMIGGKVVSVDYPANKFILLVLRPSGKYKKYTIHINKNTEFSFLFEQEKETGEEGEIELTKKEKRALFSDLQKDDDISVYFQNRVDLDLDNLTAKNIEIIRELKK